MNVLIACGGTGGHLFPGVALAEELVKRGHTPFLVISEKKVDQEAAQKYPQYTFITQPSRPKPSVKAVKKMLGFMLSLRKVTKGAKNIIKEHKIDAVIGMGGFTCFGPIFAGKSLKIPTFLHDSNAIPGKTNRLLSRYVTTVLLGLEPAKAYFKGKNCEVVGTPLRNEMKTLPPREQACEKFGLSADKPTVLIFGGSQGAEKLNSLILEVARNGEHVIQYLHVAGSHDYDRVSQASTDLPHHVTLPFCDDMPSAYAVADIVVCRSGASSLTELAYLGLPSILVPYPIAADDHQTKNAEAFSEKQAAILKKERGLDGATLEQIISELIRDDDQREMLGQNMKALSQDPAGSICNHIEQAVL